MDPYGHCLTGRNLSCFTHQELKCLNAIVCWGTFEPTVIKRPEARTV